VSPESTPWFRRILWTVFQNGYFSPPPAESMRKFFSNLHCANLVGFLEVKPIEVWGLLKVGSQEYLALKLVHTQPPAIQLLPPKGSVPGKWISTGILCIHPSLQWSEWLFAL